MSHALSRSDSSTETRRSVADTFSSSILLIGGLMILQRAIGFVRSFYVCDVLPAEEVGRWDLAFNFFVLAAPLTVLGIPGSFGRYLARYEQSGQERRFFRSSLAACVGLTMLFCTLFWVFDEQLAEYFLGASSDSRMAKLLAVGLPAVVFFNFATSWFTGKRLNRYVFRIQFAQTLFFALLCIVMFAYRGASAESVVLAYLGSCCIGLALASGYGKRDSHFEACEDSESLPIWSKVLPFAIWAWAGDALMNLFALCDRLLLVNFYPDASVDSQFLVGQYHTACIFPVLLMTVGAMAASTGLPYLSNDWEEGRRDSVNERVNLMLKLVGVIGLAVSIGVLLIAPILFGQLWKDKFALGESLLPMTLTFCSFAALGYVAQAYFWCIEKAWLGSVFLLFGLIANVVLGLLLIGRFGIEGVVASTLVAHISVLTLTLACAVWQGFRIDWGVVLICCLLPIVLLGKWFALLALVALTLIALTTEALIDAKTKASFVDRIRHLIP